MSITIPNLWPVDTIEVDIVSPIVILRTQASNLSNATKGLLNCKIDSTFSDNGKVQHHFDLVAPALGDYRFRLLNVAHDKEMVYPVQIEAPSHPLDTRTTLKAKINAAKHVFDPDNRSAATEKEFIEVLTSILGSGYTRSIIQSLLARSNDLAVSDTQSNNQLNEPKHARSTTGGKRVKAH